MTIFKSIVNESTEAICLVDDIEIVYTNRRFQELTGYTAAELSGASLDTIIGPSDHEWVVAAQQRLLTGEFDAESHAVRLLPKTGGDVSTTLSVATGSHDGQTVSILRCRQPDHVDNRDELRILKERFELAVEAAGVGLWDYNMQTGAVVFNEQWAAMLGHTLDEIEPHVDAWRSRTHPDDAARVDKAIAAHTAGELAHYDCEQRMKTAEGDWKWIRTLGKIVDRTEDGEPLRAVGLHLDVDTEKQQAANLERAQQFANLGWWYTRIHSDQIHWSPSVYKLWGLENDGGPVSSAQVRDYIHLGDRQRVEEAWETAAEGEPLDIEHRIITPEGETRWLRQRAELVFENGRAVSATGIVQDITQRKQNEASLKTTQQQLRQIIDLVPDLLFAKNREGVYLLANAKTAEIYGLSPSDVEGKREVDFLPEAAQSAVFRKDDLAVIESGQRKEIDEEELTTVDGECHILRTTKIPYTVSQTNEDAVLGYARDITALKQYERQLETQRDNLDILNQVVRHDIRNDLQLVTAYAEMLAESDSLTKPDRGYLGKIQKAADNAIDLTTSARELSAVMLQQDAELTAVSLGKTLETQLERVRSSRQAVAITTTGPIPAVEVHADELLSAVFRNVLGNAVEHNDKDLPKVTVGTHLEENTVTVRIADNGRGVPDSQKAEIFGRGNKGLESDGTGIGLYLVSSLVDRYGGAVWIEDNDPEGAIFCVELRRV